MERTHKDERGTRGAGEEGEGMLVNMEEATSYCRPAPRLCCWLVVVREMMCEWLAVVACAREQGRR